MTVRLSLRVWSAALCYTRRLRGGTAWHGPRLFLEASEGVPQLACVLLERAVVC